MRDDSFVCFNCGNYVSPLGYTARDHCPYCLYSKHVDNNPGDRACSCGGILEPIAVEPTKNSNYKIVYRCFNCNIIKRNIVARDDNFDKLLEIMANPKTY